MLNAWHGAALVVGGLDDLGFISWKLGISLMNRDYDFFLFLRVVSPKFFVQLLYYLLFSSIITDRATALVKKKKRFV